MSALANPKLLKRLSTCVLEIKAFFLVLATDPAKYKNIGGKVFENRPFISIVDFWEMQIDEITISKEEFINGMQY